MREFKGKTVTLRSKVTISIVDGFKLFQHPGGFEDHSTDILFELKPIEFVSINGYLPQYSKNSNLANAKQRADERVKELNSRK